MEILFNEVIYFLELFTGFTSPEMFLTDLQYFLPEKNNALTNFVCTKDIIIFIPGKSTVDVEDVTLL